MPISFDWSETISSLPSMPIPAEWLETQGKDVKVAFIDTGVNFGSPSLKHLNQAGRKFFTGAPGFSVAKLTGQDPVFDDMGDANAGHGTLYASLLAGKTPDIPVGDHDVVTGLANAAHYFIIKARDPSITTTITNLLNALELSANLGIEIAIIGQSVPMSELSNEGLTKAELDRVFGLPGVKQMHIFVPLENRRKGGSWETITTAFFPSLRPEVFNVAKLPIDFDRVADTIRSKPISFFAAGFGGKILTKDGGIKELKAVEPEEINRETEVALSNSGVVAIIGGLAVLAASFFKQQHGGLMPDRAQMSQMLGDCFLQIDNAASDFAPPACFKNF